MKRAAIQSAFVYTQKVRLPASRKERIHPSSNIARQFCSIVFWEVVRPFAVGESEEQSLERLPCSAAINWETAV